MDGPTVTAPVPVTPGRGRNMQAIRRRDTKPELRLRRALHAAGLRFRKDLRLDLGSVRVRPDVVFTRRKIAVFVDGCFWHACPDHGRRPTHNDWYWGPKLERNAARDRSADQALQSAGWTVIRVWEHEAMDGAVARVTVAWKHAAADCRRRA